VIRLATLTVLSLSPVFAAYQYDFSQLLNPYLAAQWTANGNYSASNGMFTSADSNGPAPQNSTKT
jgi:hypothetical protein